jgi:penicillin-binding protein 1B
VTFRSTWLRLQNRLRDVRWTQLRAWLGTRRRSTLVALGAGAVLGLAGLALVVYSVVELARFDRVEARRAAIIYAAPQPLAPGVHVRLADLPGALTRLSYVETRGAPEVPGQFRRTGGAWEIHLRGLPGQSSAQRVRLEVRDERVVHVTRDGRDIGAAALEPEVLAGAGDRPGEEHRPVRLGDAPFSLLQAVLAAEDHRFFDHPGVDLRGLLRAAWVNVRERRVAQGGSTITQQLVKNRLLDPERTLWRKLHEAWLATLVEWRYSKERILEAYLNEIYLGQRGPLAIRGVGAASRAYFGKEVHQLTVAEAALLAGMIRAPNTYSPAVNPQRARVRRDVVLARMRDLGRLSAADYEAARREPVKVDVAGAPGQVAPYFADHVRQELEARFGAGALDGRDVHVFTSLDLTLQRLAERAVGRGLERLEAQRPRRRGGERLQAALVALDPATGQIRALVGGRDYHASQFNRASLAHRQPGSAFKPFVYAAALAAPEGGGRGFTAATFLDDSPLTLTVNGEAWSPRNYEDRYQGRVTVREALQQSLNAATVRLAQDVGLPAIIERARALGIESRLEPVPAMALGSFEVTPLELGRAYLPFVNGGRRTPPARAVRLVQDRHGGLDPADDPDEERAVLTPPEAYLMTSLLEGVIDAGTGAAARSLGVTGAVAGKTGTTNDGRDAWFVGYAPGLLALVWVGYDGSLAHGLSGAEGALPIWAEFMRPALETMPATGGFTVPSGVSFAEIDLTNGKLANRFCPRTAKEVFITGTEPEACREHGGIGDRVEEWWRQLRDWLRR